MRADSDSDNVPRMSAAPRFHLTLDAEPTDPGLRVECCPDPDRCPNQVEFLGWQCELTRTHVTSARSLCRVTLPLGSIEWQHDPIDPAPGPYFTPDGREHSLHETAPL